MSGGAWNRGVLNKIRYNKVDCIIFTLLTFFTDKFVERKTK
jgi:hypothetical protein